MASQFTVLGTVSPEPVVKEWGIKPAKLDRDCEHLLYITGVIGPWLSYRIRALSKEGFF
jgi:hypothetical protein